MTALSEWKLTSEDGEVDCSLPYTMVFIGRSDCDINIECEQADKRHALISYDHYQNKFQVKDLGTTAGTYINERRIPDQTAITVDEGDSLKLGKDSKSLLVSKCAGEGTRSFQMPQSRSLDRISSSTTPSSQSGDETTHTHQLVRSNSRPTWDRRPSIAECQGCIREQDLHHSCGANSELLDVVDQTTAHVYNSTQSAEEVRASPVSPLYLRTERQSPHNQSTNQRAGSYEPANQRVDVDQLANYQSYSNHSANHGPDSQEHAYHYKENDTSSHLPAYEHDTTNQPASSGKSHQRAEVMFANANISLAAKRGTPLYGQPSWWGESDADEHNKRLLQGFQKQKEEEEKHKKSAEEDRKLHNFGKQPANQSSQSKGATETGGDSSKSLSFTVELDNSLEEKVLNTELLPSGDKLSNFLPENLRKSIRERKERLSHSSAENSPGVPRRSKSPSKIASQPDKDPPSTGKAASSADNLSSYLINKLLYASPGSVRQSGVGREVNGSDEQTEYVMYAEAKALNRASQISHDESRSSTMPELIHSQGAPKQVVSKSRTSDTFIQVDNGDKVSESGTYTIDEDNKELEKAREDIDKLFGIRSTTPDTGSPFLAITESNENLADVNGSLQVEIGSSKTDDTYDISNTANQEDETIHSSQEISQEKPRKSESPTLYHKNDAVLGKPPISPTFRSRSPEGRRVSPSALRSIGRRLPAVPGAERRREELRQSTEVNVGRSNTMPRRKKEVEYSKEKILQELGIGDTPVIEKERPKLVEELLTTRTYHKDNDPIVINKTSFYDKIVSSSAMLSPEHSKDLPQYSTADADKTAAARLSRVGGQSIDSVNTDVLLQSTDEFMKAIHSFSSDSEVSNGKSTAGKTKPTNRQSTPLKKSTADRLNNNTITRSNSGGSDLPTPRGTTGASKDNPARRSASDSVSTRLSGARRSQSSREADGNEGSLESLNNTRNQANSGRGGPLTSSRPNRTFELRRARTESMESESSTASTPRANGTRVGARSARSIDNSEVSLGARIVQKSRENGAVMDSTPKSAPIRRTDGGRYSMRATSTSNKTSSVRSTTSSSTSKPTGVKKAGGSRPNSNTMIAKAEREKEAGKEREKAAWDRRRTYDPRKAVQEAKAKKSESRGGTPSSNDDSSLSSSRPRANSYSGDNSKSVPASHHNQPSHYDHIPHYNEASDTRHSADVFQPMESNSLKLNLDKEDEDSSHELEIAQLSHNLAKDLELLSQADNDLTNRYVSKEKFHEESPETEELIESMFACQQQKSAFSSYRSLVSATPEMSSPALSPMRKKLSLSQNLENGSPNSVDNSYNNLVLTSIQRLSAKLHNHTSTTVGRLREKGVSISSSPSPTEELRGDDMPANSTLATILKTLKHVEHNCKVMDKALFTSGSHSDLSTFSGKDPVHYLAEIKRIRNEIAGFQPIESTDTKPTKVIPKSANNNKSTLNKPRTANSMAKIGTSGHKQRAVYY